MRRVFSSDEESWNLLCDLREQWRISGKTVVWSNGCFDLVHVGHIRSLCAARALGDVLVVGLNSDKSIKGIKDPTRPIIHEADRAELIAALRCVEAVVIFDEATPEKALARLRPDIHCKGAEYAPPNGRPIPERIVVESYGGRVAFLPMIEGISTSELIRRIQAVPKKDS